MPNIEDVAELVDRIMTEETRRFVAEVPYASHLTDGHALNEDYYIRHRIETVRRIRLTAKTDALSLAKMVDEDYGAARQWSRYISEELNHDALFLRDLRRHNVPGDAVTACRPFPTTLATIAFIEEEIEKVGSLAAVAYSLAVEWSSMRFSSKAVAKAERAFSTSHVSGSKSHLAIDEDEDHYRAMVAVACRVLERAGGLAVLERLIRTLCAYFRQYFTELYEATVRPPRSDSASDLRPHIAPWVTRHRDEAIDPALLPTDADVAFYKEHGWYISKTILPPDLLDRALADCWRFITGERDMPLPAELPRWRDVESLRFKMPYVSLQMIAVRNLVRTPVLGAIAARLARTPTIRLFRDALSCKPAIPGGPSGERVGWHADRAYWPTCTSDNMLTAWIPFSTCDEKQGTLIMLDGSHRWPDNLQRTLTEQDQDRTLRRLSTGGSPIVAVPIVLQKGQVSFHHCRVVHASRENRSTAARMSLVVHLQDAANRYQARNTEGGRRVAHLNDFLCRRLPAGFPDYTDPAVCPTLCGEGPALRTV